MTMVVMIVVTIMVTIVVTMFSVIITVVFDIAIACEGGLRLEQSKESKAQE